MLVLAPNLAHLPSHFFALPSPGGGGVGAWRVRWHARARVCGRVYLCICVRVGVFVCVYICVREQTIE